MEPVTTVIRQTVAPERRAEFEDLLERAFARADPANGYLGTDVQPPVGPTDPYTIVFRFASADQLRRFEGGELYAWFAEQAAPLVDDDHVSETRSGLEYWFSPPPGPVTPQPVRWRLALAFWAVIYLLVVTVNAATGVVIGDWPLPLRLAVVIGFQVVAMTYVVAPWITTRLARWIYP